MQESAKILKFHNVKRLINISDTHFGVRSNSIEWMEIQRDYFLNFLIPKLKSNYREGDALIHTGDVFDSRQSLNLRVMNMVMEIFEEISNIMPVFIICGNHDIYHKKSNTVNSIKIFKWLDNVHIYEDDVILEFQEGKTRALLMPWKDTKELEQMTIDNNSADYMYCHTDVMGLKFNSFVKVSHGNTAQSFNKFKRVYSGHIHFAQKQKNIRMVGSPYQMTRSDIGNPKKVCILDFDTDTEEFWENDYSPKFLKIKLESLIDMTLERAKHIIENNFVDILVSPAMIESFPFSALLDLFNEVNYRKLDYVITAFGDNDGNINEEHEFDESNLSLPKLIDIHCESTPYNERVTKKLKEICLEYYEKAIDNINGNNYTEEYEN